MSALLATVNITSRHALKVYVEDQLRAFRGTSPSISAARAATSTRSRSGCSQVDGVERVESLAFLRARFPEGGEVIDRGRRQAAHDAVAVAARRVRHVHPADELSYRAPAEHRPTRTRSLGRRACWRSSARSAPWGRRSSRCRARGISRCASRCNRQQRAALQDAAARRHPARSRRAESLADGSDRVGQLHPVHRHHPADAVRRGDHRAVRLGGDRHRAARRGRAPRSSTRATFSSRSTNPEVVYLGRLHRVGARSPAGTSPGRSIAWRRSIGASRATRVGIERAAGRAEPPAMSPAPEGAADDEEHGPAIRQFVVDSTTQVLLGRMERIARLVGVLSLLVALPLLWMAWVLGANLAGLLMLNERRTLGLMRLRGIPGQLMGRALLLADRRRRARRRRARPGRRARSCRCSSTSAARCRSTCSTNAQQLLFCCRFLVISVVLALVVSRRLVRYRDDHLAARGVAPRVAVRSRHERRCASVRCRRWRSSSASTRLSSAGSSDGAFSHAIDSTPVRDGRSAARLPRPAAVPLRRRDAPRLEAARDPADAGACSSGRSAASLGRFAIRHLVGEAASHDGVPADRRADGERHAVSDDHEPIVRGQGRARRARAAWRRLAAALQRARSGRCRRAARLARASSSTR